MPPKLANMYDLTKVALVWLSATASIHGIHAPNLTETDSLAASQVLHDEVSAWFPPQDGTNAFSMPLCNGFRLEEATIDDIQDALTNGHLTSVDLVLCYLQRIQQTQNYIRYEQSHLSS